LSTPRRQALRPPRRTWRRAPSPPRRARGCAGAKQIGELALAFVLSALIGLERGRGILREVLAEATRRGFAVARVATRHREVAGVAAVALTLELHGRGSVQDLALALDELDGVVEVSAAEPGDAG
jgi:hypothetical protein